ncbi:zinc finger protein-related [Abeliophyllum distichum]|uniref:Zinc finger protein-related n=1 Tax=Abeliophyllum distichum TaxID=126358 RepID=A0ABD1QIG0_9LAMI
MHGMWIALTQNMSCGNKVTDVCLPAKSKSSTSGRKPESELTDGTENLAIQPRFRQNHLRKRFYELEIGDPSRNIIETIFQTSATNPTKYSRKIKRVLKVINSLDIYEKFEKYRETVKKKSYEQYKRHPRTIVDGNELLLFYGTTTSCCGSNIKQVFELCKDPTCRVCRLIQSGFNTSYNKKNGIQLNSDSGELSENKTVIKKGKNVKRAVIVCRTIAGGVLNMDDIEHEEVYDSVGTGPYSKSEYLILRNPSAVLPCFIVVLS